MDNILASVDTTVCENQVPFIWNGIDITAAGDYPFTLPSAAGCDSTVTLVVTIIPEVYATITITASSTEVSEGEPVTFTATSENGGSNPVYAWFVNGIEIPGETSDTYTYIPQNDDEVYATITSDLECASPVPAQSNIIVLTVITKPSELDVVPVTEMIYCYGDSTGFIELTVSGGTAPFTFEWSNGETSQNRYNLPAGTYTVIVSDADGQSKTITVEITEPELLQLTGDAKNDDPAPPPTGSINIDVTGGTAPYTFEWTGPNGFASTEEDIRNLRAGNYTVVVTDANGCTVFDSYTIITMEAESWINCPPEYDVAECLSDIPPQYATFDEFKAAGGSAYSDCGIDPATFGGIEVSREGACPTYITRKYFIKDLCGNQLECTQIIRVNDVTAPVINSTPDDITVECYDNIPEPYQNYVEFYQAGGSVTENCRLNFEYLGQSDPIGAGCPETLIRTYRFDDDCGNYVDYQQRIILNDTQPPEIISVPNDTTTICARRTLNSYADFVRFGGEVIDNCKIDTGSFRLIDQFDSDELICPKTITNIYHIADYCGNAVEFTHIVRVSDTIPPVMTGPLTDTLDMDANVSNGFVNYAAIPGRRWPRN